MGYSLEVTVVLSDYLTGEVVYSGIGEHMGGTKKDDWRGAIQAALKGLAEVRGFDAQLASTRQETQIS